MNSSPPSFLLLTVMLPPCCSTAFFTIASPSPVPPIERLRPALTNDTVITVVADDDCTAQVASVPVSIPVNLFVVIFDKMYLN